MIKISNLNKYFVNGSSNLHVINNTSIELPETGLVTLLGPSGCGKTTLLNVIGGLDKFDNGSILYDDVEISKYNAKVIDEMRRNNIGYIFQNYLLLMNETVYDNLRIALEILEIYDPIEQQKRIEFALNSVGMYKFHKKKAKNLSGGQMQRVSIARALLKKNKLIIADEPTGNIDSENTQEIMNVLKKISRDTLVLLVTHEENIAYHYSDRIIKLKDGTVISDDSEFEKEDLLNIGSRKIYLQDLKKDNINQDGKEIEIYADDEEYKGKIRLIFKNNSLYVDSDYNVVSLKDSTISVVDAKYEEKIKESSESRLIFDESIYETMGINNKKSEFKSEFKDALRMAFTRRKKKFGFYFLSGILGGMMAIMIILLSTALNVSYESINQDNTHFVYTTKETSYDNISPLNDDSIFDDAVKAGYITNIYPNAIYSGSISYRENFVSSIEYSFNGYETYVLPEKLLIGHNPKAGEVVISKKLADSIIDQIGGNIKYETLLNYQVGNYYEQYVISGIADDKYNYCYFNLYDYLCRNYGTINADNDSNRYGYYDYERDRITLTSGHVPSNENEVLIEERLAVEYNYKINDMVGGKLICGFYHYNDSGFHYNVIGKEEALKSSLFNPSTNSFNLIEQVLGNYYIATDAYHLINGRLPEASDEVIVNCYSRYKLGDIYVDNYYSYGDQYKVVGVYMLNDEYLLDMDYSLENMMIQSIANYVRDHSYATRCFDVAEGGEEFFKNHSANLLSTKDYQLKALYKARTKQFSTIIVIAVIIFATVILYTYFSNRSKIANEIYTIGVKRCLGIMKKKLIRINTLFLIIQTTLSSVIAYVVVLTIYLVFRAQLSAIVTPLSFVSILLMIAGGVSIYLLNVLFGNMPLSRIINKTPSQIISRYDI